MAAINTDTYRQTRNVSFRKIPSAILNYAILLRELCEIINDLRIFFTNDGTLLIQGLCPFNERRRYFVTTSLIGWAQV